MKKTTEYKGVSWKARDRKWQAQITVKGIRFECGRFDTEIDAIKARDRKIIALSLDYKYLQVIKPMNNERQNTSDSK
jgi:hypothetical protein